MEHLAGVRDEPPPEVEERARTTRVGDAVFSRTALGAALLVVAMLAGVAIFLVVQGLPALDAARLVTAWATGFVSMELSGSFRFDGDLDQAFEYGLDRLLAGLRSR